MQQLPTILPPPPLLDGTVPTRSPEKHANLVRFQSELECLANPLYLHELHLQKYLEDPAFLEYLKYMEYWRKPEYVRFIVRAEKEEVKDEPKEEGAEKDAKTTNAEAAPATA
ncbi:transcription from Pol II promoter-related protein [Trichosporon asahii var. asahii CBS 8904]|uniref:Mediator of RNA polymerase II transcription subunit 31 n=2 Tax=Trichosporon asahii var. asahii TaxID=189963 RepID=K1WMJ1_TRIAC|nr:transcription from Pol II promoter-related protein [Trichosporon asahii var. asahii CBS 2479]EJT52976.1 transcription from Pol II promoter-related protein [Trichosporon asahii var. asahii CBS 2479]EKD02344.1 transcription from Pol II promoter-related protein [Trichosporon asahii var. asahii CBS 8904]